MSSSVTFEDFYQVPDLSFDISKLRSDLQNILRFNPSFGLVFHPKFLVFDFSYIPNLAVLNTRVGITLPIKKRRNDY